MVPCDEKITVIGSEERNYRCMFAKMVMSVKKAAQELNKQGARLFKLIDIRLYLQLSDITWNLKNSK